MTNERRSFSGAAAVTTITTDITSSDTTWSIADASGWPTGGVGRYHARIDIGTASEEKILITSRAGNVLTLASASDRGIDGSIAIAHSSGATIAHCYTARDADEANNAVVNTIGKITTKGDMIVATAAGTFGRVPAGANGEMVIYDSSQPSGVTSGPLADGAVSTTAKIADNIVTTNKLVDSSVTTPKLADANVTAAKLGNNSVTTVKITDANVTTAKLLDGAVTTVKIGDDQVTAAKVADGAIDAAAKLGADVVTTAKILDANVTTAKILNANVTAAKLEASLPRGRLGSHAVIGTLGSLGAFLDLSAGGVTIVGKLGRRYRIATWGTTFTTGGADNQNCTVQITVSVNGAFPISLAEQPGRIQLDYMHFTLFAEYTPVADASLQFQVTGGAESATAIGTADSLMVVDDVGSA